MPNVSLPLIIALLVFALPVILIIFCILFPCCEHNFEISKESDPYPDALEYWENEFSGAFIRANIVRVDRTLRCKKCGEIRHTSPMYRNMKECKQGLSFRLVERLYL